MLCTRSVNACKICMEHFNGKVTIAILFLFLVRSFYYPIVQLKTLKALCICKYKFVFCTNTAT